MRHRSDRRRHRGRALALPLVVALCLVGGGARIQAATVSSSATVASAAATADTGVRDFSFGTAASAPTAKDEQSKLWFNDGSWWGSLFNAATQKFQIYKLDGGTQTWSDTGVVVDERDKSRSDMLWDGTKLYAVTSGLTSTSTSNNARVLRYSYSPATHRYSVDSGFPVTLPTGGGMEAVGIEKDSTGRLWVTYTKNQSVYFTYSTTNDATWAQPAVLPASESTGLLTQDESAIVSFNSKIGIMWGDQARVPMAYHFATHADGDAPDVWQSSVALQAAEIADNHMNLKGLDGDPAGQVFAVVKTSLNAPTAPLYEVLRLGNDGVWTTSVFGTVADNHTRAQILLDPENRQLYVMAASPCCSGGAIYYKQASLDNITFAPGVGTPFIQLASDPTLNNISSTKQSVDTSTGFVGVASDDNTNFYAHNALALGPDTTPPETTIDSGPTGTVGTGDATFTFGSSESGSSFQCRLDASVFSSCTSPKAYTGLSDGTHTFQVQATDLAGNTDPTPAGSTWTVNTSIQNVTLAAEADARVQSNTPTKNYGTGVTLTSDGSPAIESLLRFALPANQGAVVSATLRLYTTNGSVNGPAAYIADNVWTEAGVTWNDKPARSGSALDDKGAIAASAWTEFDVTSGVAAGATVTFDLVSTSSDGADFASREATAPESRPQLVVVFAGNPPPETTIDSGPTGAVSSSSATFAFSASVPGSTFECSLDGAPFTVCTTPKSYSSLGQGSHAFQVRATSPAGSTDPTPASRTWTVDTVPPTVTAVRPSAGATGVSATANVEADFAEAMNAATITTTTFVLVQQGSSTPLSAVVTYNPTTRTAVLDPALALTPATTYMATVVSGAAGVKDLAGNALAVNRVWSFTTDAAADTTPPETTIDSGPSGAVSSTSASFTFSSNEPGSTFTCSLDGALFTTCSSPKPYTNLSQGSHTFQVRAKDIANNTDQTPASSTWTVDTLVPSAPVITSPSNGATQSSTTVALSGTAEPGATVEVFDGTSSQGTTAADAGGAWTKTLAGVSAGTHGYKATARDAAGNVSLASTVVTVTVDPPPETTIDSGPSGSVSSRSAAFTFSASEPGSTFTCSLDGAPLAACTSPQNYSGLAEGAHTFEVVATDSTGHTDPTPASRTWTVSLTLFSDGFETGDLSAWDVVTGGDGSATAQSAIVKTGSFAAQLSESATSGSFAYAREQLASAQTELRVAGDFRILTEGASGGNVPIIRLFDSSGTRIVSLYRQNLDGDKIRISHSGLSVTTSGRLPLNTWGHLELHVIAAGAGASTVEVWLDGALVYQTTAGSLATGVLTIQIGNDTKGQAFALVADDITARN